MARKPATSGQAAKQPAKTMPEASLPLDASVLSIVAGLEGHDLHGLRRQWRAHLGGEPPVQSLQRIVEVRFDHISEAIGTPAAPRAHPPRKDWLSVGK